MEGPPIKTVALVAGATAGHIAPAVAVAESLRELSPNLRCFFVLPAATSGAWMIEDAHQELERIGARPFYGTSWTERLALPLRVATVVAEARHILQARKVDLVVAFGGFGSLDVALAARSLGVPILVHEANARGGLSTRLAARLARRVFLGEESARSDFPVELSIVTGNPVRRIFAGVLEKRALRLQAESAAARVLVVGGSLGAEFLNRRVPATITRATELGAVIHVTHLAGDGNVAAIQAWYRSRGVEALVCKEIQDMAAALADADFVVSRAGASSIAELAVTATPTLFVPLPGHARGHQTANLLAASGRAALWWLSEDRWSDDEVAALLASRLRDRAWMAEAAAEMSRVAAPDAAARIAMACRQFLQSGG